MVRPSMSRPPIASASAMPQSMASSATIVARRCNWGCRRGCTVKSSGIVSCEAMTVSICSCEMAVWISAAATCGFSVRSPCVTTSAFEWLNVDSPSSVRVSWKIRSSCSWKWRSAVSASSRVMSPRPISDSV